MKNFTEIDEEFICDNCGKKVKKLGYSCRNHCPYCLHSKHVDKNPGDRKEECKGDLEPIGLEINSKKGYVIVFKCKFHQYLHTKYQYVLHQYLYQEEKAINFYNYKLLLLLEHYRE